MRLLSTWNTIPGRSVYKVSMTKKTRSCFLTLAIALIACSSDSGTQSSAKTVEPTVKIALPQGSGDLSSIEVASYWKSPDTKAAAEFYARKEYQKAKEGFTASVAETPEQSARIALMLALSESKLGEHDQAAEGFEKALRTMPDLANFLHFSAARSYFFAHKSEDSMRHAQAVSSDSIHGADAELLVGDLLRGQKGNKSVEATYAHYKNYLESRESPIRSAEARFHMAQAAQKRGKTLEAAKLAKQIRVEAPLTRWAKRAQKLQEEIEKSDFTVSKEKLTTWSAAEYITRGRVFYQKMRNEKSESDFALALEAPGLDEAMHCDASYHRANSVYKQRNRTKAAPLFLAALKSCDKANNADLYVKSAYQAGRSFATLGQRETALRYYSLIEEKHPTHSYADDARLLRAEEQEKLGNPDKVNALLSSIPTKYPSGDMAAEALWRLAWRAYKAKKYKEAISWLQKQIELAEIDDHFWAEGQALYWLARSQGKLGKTKDSLAAYKQVITNYPLSYYSLLALNRLRESHTEVFAKVVSEIHQAPPPGEDDGSFRFQEREEYKSIDFARAVEFLRLGLSSLAASELSRIGFTAPKGRERLTESDAIDRTWAVSYLQHQIGNFGRALWSTRWHILDYKRHWPTGAWRKRWEIAYPPGYWDIINKHSTEQNIPVELALSFVREESSFDPTQESFANAIGLSQLIRPTAERFAEGTGIVVSRETLRNPDNNIQIGTRFMSFLMKKWDGQLSLVPPSYNAGEGAVAKWMKKRSHWDRDAFAEEIPYDESRRYSKRVLASYFTYRYLLHDEIPLLPNQFTEKSRTPK